MNDDLKHLLLPPVNHAERPPGRTWWIPTVMCAAMVAAATGLVQRARHELPDPVATHWGATGQPNGFMSIDAFLAFAGILPAGMALVMIGIGAATRQTRAMAPLATGMTAFIGWLMTAVTLAQRGLADAHDAPSSDGAMLSAALAGAVIALVTWLLVRRWGPRRPVQPAPLPDQVPRLAVQPRQVVAWSGRTRRSPLALLAVLLLGLVPVGAMVGTAVGHRQWGTATVLLLPGIAVLAGAALLSASVTISRRGVRVRALGLVPLFTVPLEEVERAELVGDTGAMRYGGWGLRSGVDGTTALVTSSGPALKVLRAGAEPLVITVDDAERAVAVLNTLVAQRDHHEGATR